MNLKEIKKQLQEEIDRAKIMEEHHRTHEPFILRDSLYWQKRGVLAEAKLEGIELAERDYEKQMEGARMAVSHYKEAVKLITERERTCSFGCKDAKIVTVFCDKCQKQKEERDKKLAKQELIGEISQRIEKIKDQRRSEDYTTLCPPHKDCPEGCGDEGLWHQEQILTEVVQSLKKRHGVDFRSQLRERIKNLKSPNKKESKGWVKDVHFNRAIDKVLELLEDSHE